MTPGKRKKLYIAGTALLLILAAFILEVFSLLSRTDKVDQYLGDTPEERYGWRYEVLVDGQVRDYEPDFAGGYVVALPEGTEAVRISRTMTEDIPNALLEWMSFQDGVEVLLDGAPLHSDFSGLVRDSDGFVHPGREQWDQLGWDRRQIWQQMRVSLPEDYVGRTLTMITYFPPDGTVSVPEYPFLGNEDSAMAWPVVFSVRYNAVMTIYALLALAMAGMFLLDIPNSGADGRTLLLCLYFLLMFLDEAYDSEAGYYSVLLERLDLRFLQGLYMAPLYFYLALRLRSRWKWPLCGGVAAWVSWEGVWRFIRLRRDPIGTAESIGPAALVVLLAVTVALCAEHLRRGRRKKLDLFYGLTAAAVTVLYVAGRARAWKGMGSYLTDGVWQAVSMGNYWPVVTLATDIVSYMAVIVVVTEVIRRTVQSRQTVSVLRERSRLTMEGYERMLRAQEATNAANHEMRHHMTALAGLLQDGDTARAREYVASVTDALDRLPTMRYSANVLVNAVAGTYLDQAKAQGIRVECSLKIPERLKIADEDLSVFLTNLLENALHACQCLDPAEERYIRLKMALRENFLFIGCTNSAPDEQEADTYDMEERVARGHGYGLEAMRRIAERYSSMVLVERGDGAFSVKSNFNLRAPTAARSAGPRDL